MDTSAQGAPPTVQALPALQTALGDRYLLERELGRGGMATVYLARDTRHERPVAVKVLHPELAAVVGAARFLAEIRTTAALQHPHILPLFESGEAGGQLYYVMPYVEGETLRSRLTRERQLPVVDAVRIATEVASALEYAHRHGVIHRDIKPENILLGDDGQALAADFGIALALSHAGGERITQSGLSLGTPQYMAPEQAAAERAMDARVDVYALGAVTYEMLAGEPPFTGASAQAVIAKLMTEEPRALTAHRRSVPPRVEAAVMTAIEKLPADRFPTAGAFAAALGEATVSHEHAPPRVASRGLGIRRAPGAAVALGAGVLAAGIALGVVLGRSVLAPRDPVPARIPVSFVIEPDSGSLGSGNWFYSPPAIAPDGRTVVYAATGPGGPRLYARRIDDVTARPLPGTEGGDWPFFSPDGAWVGFLSRNAIRKVRLDGGTPALVTELPLSHTRIVGSTWGVDTIIFALFPSGALYRVSAAGGTPSRIPVADTSTRLMYPHLLPGGRALLVTSSADWRVGRIGVLELASGQVTRFGPGTGPHYVSGHLIYAGASGALYRQRFDLAQLKTNGPPEEIASGLDVSAACFSPFGVSPGGAVVYRAGRPGWYAALLDRAGREQRVLPGLLPWAPRFSPDGGRVAYAAFAPGLEIGDVWSAEMWRTDIWITDLASSTVRQLTTDGNDNSEPLWSPDGRSIAFDAGMLGEKDVFVRTLDGADTRRLLRRPGNQFTEDWAPDGNGILFTDPWPRPDDDIWVQPVDGSAARPYLTGPSDQNDPHVSPDGRWVAYTSNESGRAEVYLQAYPTPGQMTLVSEGGGGSPVWRRDGRELYYWQGDQLFAVSLSAGAVGAPPVVRRRTPLFRMPRMDAAGYDVSPDGMRFVLVSGGPRANRLVVALDALGADRARERSDR